MKKYKIKSYDVYENNMILHNRKAYRGGSSEEKPISSVYPFIDNDVARDNIENDLSAADLQDL